MFLFVVSKGDFVSKAYFEFVVQTDSLSRIGIFNLIESCHSNTYQDKIVGAMH